MTKSQTADVLDMMTAGIMGVKAAKATGLTPVGLERKVLPSTEAMFPNDIPSEAIVAAVREIRRQVSYIVDALDAVDETLGKADDAKPVEPDVKAAERAADAKHAIVLTPEAQKIADTIGSLGAAAKAAAFKAPDPTVVALDDDEDDEPGDEPWQCPVHGLDNIRTLTSRRGRTYRSCAVADCGEFEK